jgi:hypothetical protein
MTSGCLAKRVLVVVVVVNVGDIPAVLIISMVRMYCRHGMERLYYLSK